MPTLPYKPCEISAAVDQVHPAKNKRTDSEHTGGATKKEVLVFYAVLISVALSRPSSTIASFLIWNF